jgi:hypothetical protein
MTIRPEVDSSAEVKPGGRSPLPAHLKRERIVHDLADGRETLRGL